MIVYPNIPGGSAIFCDDIRDEVGGKVTLVGTYGSDMIVGSEAPIALPQLCCAAFVRLDKDALAENVTIQIVKHLASDTIETIALAELTDLKNLSIPEQKPVYGESKRFLSLRAAIRMSPFFIEEETTLRAIAVIDADEYLLGALTIRLGPVVPEPVVPRNSEAS